MRSDASIARPRRFGWIRQILLLATGIVVTMLLGLAWLGFPRVLVQRMLANANQGDYFVTAHEVKLNLRGGITATDVQVFRKGVIGPACLETREIRVLFRVLERPRSGQSRIKEVAARGGFIRPTWAPGGTKKGGSGLTIAGLERSGLVGIVPNMRLDVILLEFDVLGVWIDGLKTTVLVDQEGVSLSRVVGQVGRDLQRGNVEGSAVWSWQRRVTGQFTTSFDPHVLTPILTMIDPGARSFLDRFSFPSSPPRFEGSFEMDRGIPLSLSVKGRMQASQYAYQGAGIGFATVNGEYRYGNGTNRLDLDPFLMVIGGRQVRGKTEFDFSAGSASVEMMSAIDLATLLRLTGRKEQALDQWSFPDGTRVTAGGMLNFKTPQSSRLEALVEGARMGCGPLWVHDYRFKYQVTGQTNRFTDIQAKVGGGSCAGSMIVFPDIQGSNWISRVRAELIYADVDEFLKLLVTNRAWHTEGKLFGSIELNGQGGLLDMNHVSGSGQITLRKAKVFRSPLFSGLIGVMNEHKSGMDWRALSMDVRASFFVKKGRVEIADIRTTNEAIDLSAKGSFGSDRSLDFSVQVQVAESHGFLGRAIRMLAPENKPIELTLGGTIESPRWSVVKPQLDNPQ